MTVAFNMQRRPLTAEEKTWCDNLKRVYNEKKKELGLTQEKLAELCGWKSQGSVAQYFTGRIPLNTDAKIKLAWALKVPVSEIDPTMKAVKTTGAYSAKDFMMQHADAFEKMSEKDLLKLAGMIEQYVDKKGES